MSTATMRMTSGGKVKGPGTGTSDSVPVRLSNGEFVVPADSVKKIGATTLRAMVAATHKHVHAEGNKRVRRMANGGVVGDDDQQRPQVGGLFSFSVPDSVKQGAAQALASVRGPAPIGGAAPSLSDLVSARASDLTGSTPAPASPNPADQRLAAGTAAAPAPANTATPADQVGAGTGRGSINPPDATASARPDLASVPALTSTQGSNTGTDVTGAPGVRKLTTPAGGTVYTNVAGTADNDALMAKSVTPTAQNDAAAQALSNTSGASARMASAPVQAPGEAGSYIPGVNAPQTQYQQDVAATNAGVKSIFANQGVSAREQAREANAATMASNQNATTLAAAQLSAQTGLAGHQIAAGASKYATDVGAGTAAQRLALSTAEAAPKIGLSGVQLEDAQQRQQLQKQYLAATDPVERRRLYEALIASQGHVRSLSERFTAVGQGSEVDPATGLMTQKPHLLFDNQVGQWVQPPNGGGASARMQGQAMPTTKDKLVAGSMYQTPRGLAKWDGKQFVAQ